jgi:tellurite resistance protein
MQNEARINFLARVARTARPPVVDAAASRSVDAAASRTDADASGANGPGHSGSILSLVAVSYGMRPSGDATVPTGFDPIAIALFEAIVEGAYVVANADGVFDDEERHAFERVVLAACGGAVAAPQILALVGDLADQLEEDGVDRRIEMIAQNVTKKEHAREVLRIAALLAHASDDVSDVEREVLAKLARQFGIDPGEVDTALAEAKDAIAAAARSVSAG